MDVYLDLSLMMNGLMYGFIFLYINKIGNIKFSLVRKLVIIFFLLLKFYFLPLIPSKMTIFYYLYDLIIFLLLFNKKKIYTTILFIFIYYMFASFFMFIEPHILMFKKLLIISSPSATTKLIFLPIPLLLGYYLLNILKNKYIQYKYSYNTQLKYNEQIISLKGYLDSGNTLQVKGIPVIFVKSNLGIKDLNYNKIPIEYITVSGNMNKAMGYLGKIAIKTKKGVVIKKVIFSIVQGEHSFHNCDCLLNAYLL